MRTVTGERRTEMIIRMNKLKNRNGMTMAEVLIVVAIVAVLLGVGFVAVLNYRRSLGQLERDDIAKEIFVAAQNHLTAAFGEGYPGTDDFGTEEGAETGEGEGIHYFIVSDYSGNDPASRIPENTALAHMLPFGSIDETVRAGGNYIIRYQKDSGLVLDVFYCSRKGSPQQYNYSLSSGDYAEALSLRDAEGVNNKRQRRNWNRHILGWYGGADAASLPSTTLLPPSIIVHNEEKLYVEVTNPNSGNVYAKLKLIITGTESKAQKAFELQFVQTGEDQGRTIPSGDGTSFTVILDDITAAGMHFSDIAADTDDAKFIPGENIEIQAMAYSSTVLANISYSAKRVTNSLFSGINSSNDTALIGNIRHLENLDRTVSNLGAGDPGIINIQKAEQVDNFSWTTFQKEIVNIKSGLPRGTDHDSGYLQEIYQYGSNDAATAEGCYLPIAPNYELVYDGQKHSISDVAVNITGDAGLFSKTPGGVSWDINNLELIDFNIKGTDSAGALAGTLKQCTVTNVLARNSAGEFSGTITGETAGGLAGVTDSGTIIQYSAAAVVVNGSATAGGLIGNADGTITSCYSGGHTKNGSYEERVKNNSHPYDVTGEMAGGLVGSSSASISCSYSTCSVSGTTAGGFAGSAGGSIENCYAAGLVKGTSRQFALIGNGTLSSENPGNCYYREINKDGEGEAMQPFQNAGEVSSHISYVKPIDLNADSYNDFAGELSEWDPAWAYDSPLVKYYGGLYPLRTVLQLPASEAKAASPAGTYFVSVHYGDWPSPEVFFINTAQ